MKSPRIVATPALMAFALALAMSTTRATAGEIKPYTPQEFDTLTRAGKPVLVDINAAWCPTCKAQKPVLERLMDQPEYRDVTMLKVDFDKDRAAVKRFKATVQATLVAFKGTAEVGRLVGNTQPADLENLIKKTVK